MTTHYKILSFWLWSYSYASQIVSHATQGFVCGAAREWGNWGASWLGCGNVRFVSWKCRVFGADVFWSFEISEWWYWRRRCCYWWCFGLDGSSCWEVLLVWDCQSILKKSWIHLWDLLAVNWDRAAAETNALGCGADRLVLNVDHTDRQTIIEHHHPLVWHHWMATIHWIEIQWWHRRIPWNRGWARPYLCYCCCHRCRYSIFVIIVVKEIKVIHIVDAMFGEEEEYGIVEKIICIAQEGCEGHGDDIFEYDNDCFRIPRTVIYDYELCFLFHVL